MALCELSEARNENEPAGCGLRQPEPAVLNSIRRFTQEHSMVQELSPGVILQKAEMFCQRVISTGNQTGLSVRFRPRRKEPVAHSEKSGRRSTDSAVSGLAEARSSPLQGSLLQPAGHGILTVESPIESGGLTAPFSRRGQEMPSLHSRGKRRVARSGCTRGGFVLRNSETSFAAGQNGAPAEVKRSISPRMSPERHSRQGFCFRQWP